MVVGVSCHRIPLLGCAFLAFLVSGCGGGSNGGGSGPVTPPVNTAPTFTSSGTANAVENTTGVVYAATATDAEGNPLTFSISGGADAARFAITPAGALTFTTAPNFELPSDADRDNVYQVVLNASDGALNTTLNLSITVTNSREGIQVRRIATGFTYPVGVGSLPGDTRLIVAAVGALYLFDPATGSRTRIAGTPCNEIASFFTPMVSMVVGERNYPNDNNPNIFVLCQGNPTGLYIENYDLSADRLTLSNPVRVMTVPFPAGGTARGNQDPRGLAFDRASRTLIAALPVNAVIADSDAQNPASDLGKIFKIVQNPNPLAGPSPNYWTISRIGSGIRAPGGVTVYGNSVLFADNNTGQMEINRLDLGATGQNFGWPFKDGTQTIQTGAPAGLVDPVAEYTARADFPGGIGGAVGVGATGVGSLAGVYVFASPRTGDIFTVPVTSLRLGTTLTRADFERRNLDFAPDVGTIGPLTGIVQDGNGNIYLLDLDGNIFRVDVTT